MLFGNNLLKKKMYDDESVFFLFFFNSFVFKILIDFKWLFGV